MNKIDWEAVPGRLSNSYAILYRPNFRVCLLYGTIYPNDKKYCDKFFYRRISRSSIAKEHRNESVIKIFHYFFKSFEKPDEVNISKSWNLFHSSGLMRFQKLDSI